MFKKLCYSLKNRKGFTLVELMVVVVIIGILAAIAVPVYNNATDGAKQSAVEANLRTIDGAIMMYQANNEGDIPAKTDLEGGAYLQAWPDGPDDVEYTIVTGRATATSTAGGFDMVATISYQLEDLPWRQ